MVSVTLHSFKHKSKKCIGLKFRYIFKVKELIKRGPNVQWSRTHSCFYIVYTTSNLKALIDYLEAQQYNVVHRERLDMSHPNKVIASKNKTLTEEKALAYGHFLKFLKGKRFSANTLKVYGKFVFEFLFYTKDKPIDTLNENDVRLFIEWTVGTLNYAVSTHRQMVSGLKHFAHFYPTCSIDTEAIYMPRKDKKLPVILSVEEIMSLLQVTKNLKHRTIIAMLYASGLRIGELLNLELRDFDFKRNQLHIRNAKGRKDRYATIAKSLHPLLKNYHDTYRPKVYFIENPKGGSYSPGAVRTFLKQRCFECGITKKVSPHSLRHSYATHLLEQGTDIRHIQELLGHSRPETTMIYTQVTQKELREIRSPLDTAINSLSLPNNNNKKPLIS